MKPEREQTVRLWPSIAKILGLDRTAAIAAADRGAIPGTFMVGPNYHVRLDVFNRAMFPKSAQRQGAMGQ